MIWTTVSHCRTYWCLIPFNVEERLSETVNVAVAVKTILIKRITSENKKRLPVDRFRVCKSRNVSADKKKDGQPNKFTKI